MDAIKIGVNKNMDGYVFSLAPAIRDSIKKSFPHAQPANTIFVAYDMRSDFQHYIGGLEQHIHYILLGIGDKKDLQKIKEIEYFDMMTGNSMHKLRP